MNGVKMVFVNKTNLNLRNKLHSIKQHRKPSN